MAWWTRFTEWEEPEYPKLDEPLQTFYVTGGTKRKPVVEELFVGHVRTGETTGRYMECGHPDEFGALEEAANFVVETRRNKKLLGKF